MRRNANISKYLSKITKLNVNLDIQNNAKTNGFALIIQNKKILITARTKNGNQPIKAASIFIQKTARMFPSLDTSTYKKVLLADCKKFDRILVSHLACNNFLILQNMS